jgi:hypothetical protein
LGASIQHILIDGRLETHGEALARLMKQLRLSGEGDLFRDESTLLDEAYERQGRRIAYERPATQKGG